MKSPSVEFNKLLMENAESRNKASKKRRHEKKHRKLEKLKKTIINDRVRKLHLRAKLQGIKRVTVDFPSHFSIVDNPRESLPHFTDIIIRITKGHPLYLNANSVQTITIDTLLYLLSLFNKFKWFSIDFSVMGKAPDSEPAKSIFVESGFYEYVRSTRKFANKGDCVQIHTGVDADSTIAKSLCQFSMLKLGLARNDTKGLYDIVMEIILNTIQHAYDRDKRHNKWYIYARFDPLSQEIFFAILDTGHGIPTTVKTKFLETVQRLANALFPGSLLVDAKIIQSALNGEFRTQTGLGYRGKGIPRIAHYCNVKYISDLKIVSAQGYVSHEDNRLEALPDGFIGTLYSWKMKKRA